MRQQVSAKKLLCRQRRVFTGISLPPRFNGVLMAAKNVRTASAVSGRKTAKAVECAGAFLNTPLKQGVNETVRRSAQILRRVAQIEKDEESRPNE